MTEGLGIIEENNTSSWNEEKVKIFEYLYTKNESSVDGTFGNFSAFFKLGSLGEVFLLILNTTLTSFLLNFLMGDFELKIAVAITLGLLFSLILFPITDTILINHLSKTKKIDDYIKIFKEVIEYNGYNSELYIKTLLGDGNVKIEEILSYKEEQKIIEETKNLISIKRKNNYNNQYILEKFFNKKFLEEDKKEFIENERERLKKDIKKQNNSKESRKVISLLEKAKEEVTLKQFNN